jgi:hypothetical protein
MTSLCSLFALLRKEITKDEVVTRCEKGGGLLEKEVSLF